MDVVESRLAKKGEEFIRCCTWESERKSDKFLTEKINLILDLFVMFDSNLVSIYT